MSTNRELLLLFVTERGHKTDNKQTKTTNDIRQRRQTRTTNMTQKNGQTHLKAARQLREIYARQSHAAAAAPAAV